MATINGIVKELQNIKGTVRDKNRISGSVAAILLQGEGMTGEFTICTLATGGDYEIDKIESDKVKIVIGAGVSYGCYRLGSRGSTIKKGTQKLIWVNLVSDSSVIHFYGSALGAEGIFLAGNEGSMDLVYSGYHNHNLMFLAVNLGINQWIITPYGLGNVDEMIQNSLGDYVEKVTGKSLVADTEIAKIHSQNTDTSLDVGGENEISAASIKGAITQMSEVSDFTAYNDNPDAYTIPHVQDILGVKSLKYSADFVFEAGTLKVKGAGNTTGKTLSIFNLAGTENLTVLDNGNVGIKKSDTDAPLHIYGTTSGFKPAMWVSDNNSNVGAAQFFQWRGGSVNNKIHGIIADSFGINFYRIVDAGNSFVSSTPDFTISPTGKVGISILTPAKSLEVSHATGDCFRLSYDKSTTYKADFTLDSAGKLTIAAAGGHEFTGDVNLTGVLKIDGVQVIKEQQAALTDHTLTFTSNPLTATTSATIDRGDNPTVGEVAQVCTNLDLAIQKIVTVLRTHGLIATT